MTLSRERLRREAATTGFRAEILEKVARLLELLERFNRHPFLKGRFVLKGGTALNLFVFDVPRLSVDLDLNYVGQPEGEAMRAERPDVERAVAAVCGRSGVTVERASDAHAGGKWQLRYESADRQSANLELDVNYMLRIPLWEPKPCTAKPFGTLLTPAFPVLDVHELAAGKLVALLARKASRDLFDAHHLLTRGTLDAQRLRIAFVVYGAMNRKDWRTAAGDDAEFDLREVRNHLVPTLRSEFLDETKGASTWAQSLIDECRDALRAVLPLTEAEHEFLDRLLDHGEIAPALLTNVLELAERISEQPMLAWKAINVVKHSE